MDKYDTLHSTIANSFDLIVEKFSDQELRAFQKSHEDEIICPPEIRTWIRDELIGCDSPLLNAFIAFSYSDRDDMAEYIIQELKDFIDGLTRAAK